MYKKMYKKRKRVDCFDKNVVEQSKKGWEAFEENVYHTKAVAGTSKSKVAPAKE